MKGRKNHFRIFWSLLLTAAMVIGTPSLAMAADEVTGSETIEADGSVLNTDQNSDMWLVKGQSYKLSDYSYSYDTAANLIKIDKKGKLTAGKKDGAISVTIFAPGTSQAVLIDIQGKGKAKVDKAGKKITIGKGKSISLPSLMSFSITGAKDAAGTALTGKAIKKVATLSKGKITAKGPGTAYVKLSGLVENTYTVEIGDPKLSATKLIVDVGSYDGTITLAGSQLPVEWYSSNTSVATIAKTESDNVVRIDAMSAGNSVINAEVNGKIYSCKVKVKAVKNKPSSARMHLNAVGKGKSKTISYKGIKAGNIKWVSTDPTIATVNNKGKVTAVKPGITQVYAYSKDGSTTYGSSYVYVHSVTVPKDVTVPLKGFVHVPVSFDDGTGHDDFPVTWKSSKTSIATVNGRGFVRGVKVGKTKLTTNILGNKYTVNVDVRSGISSSHTHSYVAYGDKGVKYCADCGNWYMPGIHTITFDSKGGTNPLGSLKLAEGETVASLGYSSLPESVKEGSAFLGWYMDEDLTQLFEVRQPIYGNFTLYAGWKEIPTDTEGKINDPGFINDKCGIDSFRASTSEVPAGGSGQAVIFYAELSSQQLIDTAANEITVVEGSTKVTTLKDNGIAPDVTENDGIFTGAATLSSSERGSKEYKAKFKEEVSNPVNIYFYTDIPEDEKTAAGTLAGDLNDADNADDAEQLLTNSGIVSEDKIIRSSDGNQIIYQTDNGITGIWEKAPTGTTSGEALKGTPSFGSYATINRSSGGLSYSDVETALASKVISPVNSKKDICVVRPFHGSQFYYDDFETAGNILKNALKSNCDVIDDGSATSNTFKNFGGYGLVLIDSHGTLSNVTNAAWTIFDTDPYMLTGETISGWDAFTSADWQSERIVVVSESGGLGGFFGGIVAVGSGFFDTYYDDGDLDNTAFFLGTCYSAHNDKLAKSLLNKGAEVVYGYSEPVTTKYCNDTLFELVLDELLLKGSSAGTAFNNTLATCGSPDPFNNDDETYLRFYGDSNYHLVRSETSSTISGRVSAYGGGELSNAIVNFIDSDNSVRRTRVESDGSFTQSLPAGTYTIEVTAYGYISETRTGIVLEEGQNLNLDESIMLHPSDEGTSISGKITSSMDGNGVSYAQIRFRRDHDNITGDYLEYAAGGVVSDYTDSAGYYSFASLPTGYYTMEVTRAGYYPAYRNIIATAGTNEQNLQITPTIYGSDEALRIVLEWGEFPYDLDSHLVGPRPDTGKFHTWYSDLDAYSGGRMFANLDLDDTTSFGPETTRVYDITTGDYFFYVHNYSADDKMPTSGARVHVYDKNGLLNTFNVPMNQGTALYWNVFTYRYDKSSGTGRVIPINTITESPDVDLTDCYNNDPGYSYGNDGRIPADGRVNKEKLNKQ